MKSEKVRMSILFTFPLLLFTSLAQADVLDKAYLAADGAEALYGEIMAAADRLSFTSAAEKMTDRNVMLALGRYDHVVPLKPIDAFWSVLDGIAEVRVRKEYPTSHGFMGVRVAFAADIADFIRTAAQVQ